MRTYKFGNPEDMIALAKTVQSSVYWGMRFYYEPEDEDISFTSFWDYVEWSLGEGYNAVSISNNNHVEFVRV